MAGAAVRATLKGRMGSHLIRVSKTTTLLSMLLVFVGGNVWLRARSEGTPLAPRCSSRRASPLSPARCITVLFHACSLPRGIRKKKNSGQGPASTSKGVQGLPMAPMHGNEPPCAGAIGSPVTSYADIGHVRNVPQWSRADQHRHVVGRSQ